MSHIPMAAQSDEERMIVQQTSMPLYESKGWMKLNGIIYIINGVFAALTIVGILFAWIPIWMGVVLYKAGSEVEIAEQTGSRYSMIETLKNLKTFFTIMGVLNLIGIILIVASICLIVILALSGVYFWEGYY